MQYQLSISYRLWLCLGYVILSLGLSPITKTLLPSIGNVIEPFIFIGIHFIIRNSQFRIPFVRVFKSKYCIIFLFAMGLVGLLPPQGKAMMENVYTNITPQPYDKDNNTQKN